MNEVLEFIYQLLYYWRYPAYFFGGLFILRLILKKAWRIYHSKWNTLIDNFNMSSKEFYDLLLARVNEKRIGNVQYETKLLPTAGIFSPRRKYFQLKWKDYIVLCCAAPFGRGFFVSHWTYQTIHIGHLIYAIPFIGRWLVKKLYPQTLYKSDSSSMFMTYVHQCVLEVIDDITEEKGLRSLNERERTPTLFDPFKR